MRSTIRTGFPAAEGEASGDDRFVDAEGELVDDAGDVPDHPDVPNRVECAAYISDLSGALARLASRSGMRKLALFLHAAENEALMVQRHIALGRHDSIDRPGTEAT